MLQYCWMKTPSSKSGSACCSHLLVDFLRILVMGKSFGHVWSISLLQHVVQLSIWISCAADHHCRAQDSQLPCDALMSWHTRCEPSAARCCLFPGVIRADTAQTTQRS